MAKLNIVLKRKGIKESRDGLLERSRCDYLH